MNALARAEPCTTAESLRRDLSSGAADRTPALLAPTEGAMHPRVDSIEAETVAWALSQRLVGEDRGLGRVRASRVGRLAGRALARAPEDAARLASDWTLLFCLIDDWVESQAIDGTDLELALTGRSTSAAAPLAACSDVYQRIARRAPASLVSRWVQAMRELFTMFGVEERARRSGEPSNLASYAARREVTSGIPSLLLIHELVGPRAGQPSLEGARLARRGARLVGFANDLHTFRREIAELEPNNLVAVVAKEEGLRLAGAVARAAELHDLETAAFFSHAGRVIAGEGRREDAVAVARARAWVTAHNAWALETRRYDRASSSALSTTSRAVSTATATALFTSRIEP